MSIELEEAKTKVAQFQKQCEEFLVVIVQQKRDADEQQKVTIEILFHSRKLTAWLDNQSAYFACGCPSFNVTILKGLCYAILVLS